MDSTSNLTLTRDEAWDFMYRVRPYLAAATEDELRSRLADVLRNLYTLTPEGKIGALAPSQGGLVWLQKFSDLLLEYKRRNSRLEDAVHPESIPFNRAALSLVRANQEFADVAGIRSVPCRYGELRWMRALYERGELLLSPASYYKAVEHGLARQDDELVLRVVVTPYDYDLGRIPPTLFAHIPPRRSWGYVDHEKPCDH